MTRHATLVAPLFLSLATAALAAPPLLSPPATTKAALVAPFEPAILRRRAVDVDTAALAAAAHRLPQVMEAAFFTDAAPTLVLTRAEPARDGWLLSGSVAGDAGSSVFLLVRDGAVTANVRTAGRLYQLGFRQDAATFGQVLHEAREVDTARFNDHDPRHAAHEAKVPRLAASLGKAAAVSADDGSLVDLLVGYTPDARAAAGGTAAVEALIDLSVAETNRAYENSGVLHRVRLLRAIEVPYTESGTASTDLGRLRRMNDNHLEVLHAWRAALGADIVSLLVDRMDDACGIGGLMTNVGPNFAASAFNVVARRCAAGNFTLAHEIGHNMGLRHDRFQDPGLTPYPDAHGYVDTVARFRTVMAYNDACTTQGFSCTRIPNFSNPLVSHLGVPTGVAGEADAVRVLNVTRFTVARFATAVDTSQGTPMLFIRTAYAGSEGGSVELSVERIPGSAGPATVNYATVAGTALPGEDYQPVAGTISWAAGDSAPKSIVVPLMQDAATEGTERFTVQLSAPTGGSLGLNTVATVDVQDDEPGVFPAGCTFPAGWSNAVPGAALGWATASDSAAEGRCSLKSGPIGDAPTTARPVVTRMSVTGHYLAGSVRFARRVSSEDTFDCFRFTIDGKEQDVGGQCSQVGGLGASGEVPWGTVTIPVTAGTHTFTWSYEKDLNTVEGEDAAWIDAVELPPAGVLLTVAREGSGEGSVRGADLDCGPRCGTVLPAGALVTLVAEAAAGSAFAGWSGACAGSGPCSVSLDQARHAVATFTAAAPAPADYSDMWWAGAALDNGWGLSITQHKATRQLFAALYVYEADRSATWFVLPGGSWNADFTAFTGAVYRPAGTALDAFSGITVGASVGTMTLRFTSATTAELEYTLNGTSGRKTLSRQPFGEPGTPNVPRVADLWYAGEAGTGWGVSISQQFNNLFAVWYTYAKDGRATWFVVPNGAWSGTTWSGPLYATTGSPWLTGTYNPSFLVASEVGTLSITFTPEAGGATASAASMRYSFTAGPFSGVTQTRSIIRQPF